MNRRWLAIGLAAALVLAATGWWIAGQIHARGENMAVSVNDLSGDRGRWEGRTVSLVLKYDKRSPDDPAAERQTRSDCYLHDDTGSILLFGGWQAWIEWRDSGEFSSDWLDVDPAGTWTVKRALVRYDDAGMPFLEAPEEEG